MELAAFQTPLVIGHYGHDAFSARTLLSHLQNISAKYRIRQTPQTRISHVPVHCAFDGPSKPSAATETELNELVSDATIVTAQLPLDVYLEETIDGRIFVDELVPGGNAETSGLLLEGDVITAVSLPFGDTLFPVPNSKGLEMIASYIESRDGDTFRLAIVRTTSAQVLRSQTAEKSENAVSVAQHVEYTREIHVPEYPIRPSDEPGTSLSDTDFVPDLESLRRHGFDLDDITDGSHGES